MRKLSIHCCKSLRVGFSILKLSSSLTDCGTGANFLNFPPSVVALAALLWHLTKNSEQSSLPQSFALNDLSEKIVQPTIRLFDTRRLVCESRLWP